MLEMYCSISTGAVLKEAGYTKEQQEIAMRCVFTHPLWDQLDKGTVMEKEALQEFIKADPAQEALIREIAGRTKETLFPLSYADDWVKSLKAQGYPVYILSNYAGELYEKTKHLMTFLQYVDDALFSYQCKMIKPDREIYAYACEKFNILPQETVFIDDPHQNIASCKGVWAAGSAVYLLRRNLRRASCTTWQMKFPLCLMSVSFPLSTVNISVIK